MRRARFKVLFLPLALLAARPALADPCKAIPDRGALSARWKQDLRKGATFQGPVTYVGDGDSLCVATGVDGAGDPRRWVEVRLADYYAPELKTPEGRAAKTVLTRLAKGRQAVCRADHRSYDRIVATCRLGGTSLGDLMRGQGLAEGGNAWGKAPQRPGESAR